MRGQLNVAIGVLLGLVGSPCGVLADERPPAPPKRLRILLTTAPQLGHDARIAMMNEARAIWKPQGVTIEWQQPTEIHARSSDQLRVFVVPSRPTAEPDAPFAVGELVRVPDSHPLAILSIESAQRLVSSVRGRAGYELISVDARRLGVVLGRALAHEIGHFLLDTQTHAERGLMRPQFSALEFTDMRDAAFTLDAEAAAWLRTGEMGPFTYAAP